MWKPLIVGALATSALLAYPAAASTTIVSSGESVPGSSMWSVAYEGGGAVPITVGRGPANLPDPVAGSDWIRSVSRDASVITEGVYIFTHVFALSDVKKVQSVVLNWVADNQVTEVFLNGFSLFGGPVATNSSIRNDRGSFSVTLPNNLVQDGDNTMEWYVYNRQSTGNTNSVALSSTAAITTAVPEPGTWMLMIFGLGAVGFSMRRRQRSAVRLQFA